MDILDTVLMPHPEAKISKVGEEAVILHLVNATYCGLDPIGLAIWDGLKSGKLSRAICREIADDCEVEVSEVEADTRLFLADLLEQELLIRG